MLPLDDRSVGRERLSRVLSVASALFTLVALITAGVAALGLFGLAGTPVDPAAADPARLLGLPWSLGINSATAQTPAINLALTCGALGLNAVLLAVAGRLAHSRAR